MKKSTLLILGIVALLSYSCNIAKTCPTYAKGNSANLESAAKK